MDRIYRSILLLLSALLVVFLFPKEGTFQYEYHKGSPWKHENLIAPFDFPIYKIEQEIANEHDSIVNNFRPYFTYEAMVAKDEINRFEYDFTTRLQNDSVPFTKKKIKALNKWKDSVVQYFTVIYDDGIIEYSAEQETGESNKSVFLLLKNNEAAEYDFGQIPTQKYVYEKLIEQLENNRNKNNTELLDFLVQINLNEYLAPNVLYNKPFSEKVLNESLESISYTYGMLQAGERIIFKGELVDNTRYRILESFKKEYVMELEGAINIFLINLGQFILVFGIFIALLLYLQKFEMKILASNKQTLFILLLILFQISMTALILKSEMISLYILPFTILPFIIDTFYNLRLALFIHTLVLLLLGFLVPNGYEFFFIQFLVGVTTVFSSKQLYRRSRLFITSSLILFSYALLYFAISITQEGDLNKIEWINLMWFVGSSVLFLSSYPAIYIFEKLFGFLSDVSLLELSDTNQPLLRKLSEEAAGTFQHSMQVANLAESAIFTIGGNPLLARTGALYHDIGKIATPAFFIENQISGINPHDELDCAKSVEIITNHVNNGLLIGKKHKLPVQIIDFVRTHHGASRVEYFYRTFKNKFPNKEIDESIFHYPGPNPFSKETAVVMMADSVEAASRTLKEYTDESIRELIDQIIDNQSNRGLFNQAPITFVDISRIKKVFRLKLKNIYHARISYPK